MSSNVCFTRLFLKSASYSSYAEHEVYKLKYVKLGQFDFFHDSKIFTDGSEKATAVQKGKARSISCLCQGFQK